jgi:hypothetical protein
MLNSVELVHPAPMSRKVPSDRVVDQERPPIRFIASTTMTECPIWRRSLRRFICLSPGIV